MKGGELLALVGCGLVLLLVLIDRVSGGDWGWLGPLLGWGFAVVVLLAVLTLALWVIKTIWGLV